MPFRHFSSYMSMVSWPTRRGQQHPMASLFNLQDGVQRRVTADWVGWVQKSKWNHSTVVVVLMKQMKFMERFILLLWKFISKKIDNSMGFCVCSLNKTWVCLEFIGGYQYLWRWFITLKHFLVSSNFVGICLKRKNSQKKSPWRLNGFRALGSMGVV